MTRPACVALLFLALAPLPVGAAVPSPETEAQSTPEPALTVLEVAAGLPAQAVAVVVLSVAYSSLGLQPSIGAEALAATMFVALAPAVSSLAVWGVGNLSGRYRPSLVFTFLGGAAGGAAGLVAYLALGAGLSALTGGHPSFSQAAAFAVAAVVLVVVPPVVGEVIASNLTKAPLSGARQASRLPRLQLPLPEVVTCPGRPTQIRLGLLRGSF